MSNEGWCVWCQEIYIFKTHCRTRARARHTLAHFMQSAILTRKYFVRLICTNLKFKFCFHSPSRARVRSCVWRWNYAKHVILPNWIIPQQKNILCGFGISSAKIDQINFIVQLTSTLKIEMNTCLGKPNSSSSSKTQKSWELVATKPPLSSPPPSPMNSCNIKICQMPQHVNWHNDSMNVCRLAIERWGLIHYSFII